MTVWVSEAVLQLRAASRFARTQTIVEAANIAVATAFASDCPLVMDRRVITVLETLTMYTGRQKVPLASGWERVL